MPSTGRPRLPRTAALAALAAGVLVPASVATSAAVIYGTPGPNRLVVTNVAPATVYGDGGRDRIIGNTGADRLFGETGPDRIFGRGGDDLLDGDTGDDYLDGAEGNDTGLGGFGHDVMLGGVGNDTLDGGSAPDKLYGQDGDDTLTGGSASDVIDGGAGNDQIFTSGPDVVQGGLGDDVIHGNQDVVGVIRTIDCGPGRDTLFLPSTGRSAPASKAKLDSGQYVGCETVRFVPEERGPMQGVRRGVGSYSNASLVGTDRNDALNGAHGSNKIRGLAGDDLIYTDSRKPTSSAGIRRSRKQHDRGDGGAGNDFVIGGVGTNVLLGGAGDDQIRGGNARNTIYGGAGSDAIRVSGGGRNRVFGGPGNDAIAVATKRKAIIDCGPGEDTVRVGRVRARVRHCEHVVSAYRK